MTIPPPRTADSRAPLEVKPVLDWLFWLAVLAVGALYVRAILITPMDALQGNAQKIYYVHIAAWLPAYFAIGVMALMSVVYLWLHDERADRLGEACAEVALIFLSVGLTTGMIWARVIWGAWWVWWEMRLTLALFLWFVVAGYLVMRGAIEEDHQRARYSAVLGVLSALLIPFIHLSVYLFSTMHPKPIIGKPDKPSLPSEMLITFLISFFAFTLLYFAFLRSRYAYAVERDARAARIENA